jgi:hypothetical protein
MVMLPHISKTGDTTHEAPFPATACIMLLIRAVFMAAISQKTHHQIFINHHNNDIIHADS